VERRSPDGIEAEARREETRLQEHPAATGEPDDLPETFAVNGEGLPEKVFSLRQKLYRKAKRQPKTTGDAVTAARRTIRESRMRENRPSGSTRED